MSDNAPRVLVVLASADRRGAEVEALGFARELARSGRQAHAVALRPASEGAGLDIEVIGNGVPRSLSTLRAVRRRAHDYAVVIGYGSVTLPVLAFATLGLRTRFVYRSIGTPADWARGRLHRARTGWLFRRADHVVALFDGAAASIRHLYRVPADRITVIPNARSPEFKPATPAMREEARRRYGLDSDARVVAQVGSIAREKRVHLGIEAASLAAGLELLVVGDGPERIAITSAARRATHGVHLLGQVDDVANVYHAADIVLLTSSTEGMPGVLIEAGLCGLPFVATDVGAVSSMAGPYDVVIPTTSTASEIRAHIDRSLSRTIDRDEIARDAARRYSWQGVLPMWTALLAELSRSHDAS